MNPFLLTWTIWMLVWLAAWAWSKRSRKRESAGTLSLHMVPLLLASWLMLAHRVPVAGLDSRVVPQLSAFYGIGLALTIGGLAFAVWARLYIGSNWSASVQVKTDHHLVTTGPYRFVRHPIYTGMLVGFLGSALAMDRWRGVLAVALVLGAFIYKLRLEERWMTETFGDAYRDYRQRTRALIPFVY